MRLIIIIHSLFLKIEHPLTISKEKLIWGGELGIKAMKQVNRNFLFIWVCFTLHHNSMISIAQRLNFNVLKGTERLSRSWVCLPSPHLSPTTSALYLRNAICSVPHCMSLHESPLTLFPLPVTLDISLFQTKSHSFFESRLRIITSRKSLLTGWTSALTRVASLPWLCITKLMLLVLHVYFPLSLPKFGCLNNLFWPLVLFPFQGKFMPTLLCKHSRFLRQ